VGGFNGNDRIYGGPGEDTGNGGYGNDVVVDFEVAFDPTGPGTPLVTAPIPHLRAATTRHATARLGRYRRHLARVKHADSARSISFMYARCRQLGDAAHRQIRERYRRDLRRRSRQRASLLRSERSHHVRALLIGVSAEIDRLVLDYAAQQ